MALDDGAVGAVVEQGCVVHNSDLVASVAKVSRERAVEALNANDHQS